MAKALPKDVVKEEIVLNVNLSDEQQKLTRKIFRGARYVAQADGAGGGSGQQQQQQQVVCRYV